MDGIRINIMLVIVSAAGIIKLVDGYKKGIVKEVVSLITMLVLCLVAALAAYGMHSYHDGKAFNVIVAIILFCLIVAAHHLLGLVLFPAKLLSKLPVLHLLDKLLGIVFGAFEVVLALWTLYTFIMMMNMGAIGQLILSYTEESPVLLWLYRHNYLAYGIERMLEQFSFVPLELLK
ncbi:MAG: CvpA family protein [Lachnospiraceae bacterium]|jgi:hypothetical protein|nr:CvpA family protein [uncultured Acetatifactor sp.]MCI8801189.1 CvpA family protein [Lachnospiraceae bacterium]